MKSKAKITIAEGKENPAINLEVETEYTATEYCQMMKGGMEIIKEIWNERNSILNFFKQIELQKRTLREEN